MLAVPVAAALLVGLAACSAGPGLAATPTTDGTVVTVSVDHCGEGWTHGDPGQQTFVLRNRDISSAEVYLTDAASQKVYAYVDNIGPDASADMSIDLPSGHYVFRCAVSDQDVATGPEVVVAGHHKGAASPVAAVSQVEMITATKQYEDYVSGLLPGLSALAAQLDADIRAGDLTRARTDWLPAHLAYERLGAAYNAFGDIDGSINGTSAGLEGGAADSGFTGFHRIERGLWGGEDAATLAPIADGLVTDVATLLQEFPTAQIDPLDVAIRAHEITENALQFELTGKTDYGSGTTLATVDANLDGTKAVLDLLKPILTSRYPGLQHVYAEIAAAASDIEATRSGGQWRPLAALSTAQRERVDSDISELTQLLAPIASICEPRRTT